MTEPPWWHTIDLPGIVVPAILIIGALFWIGAVWLAPCRVSLTRWWASSARHLANNMGNPRRPP